MSTPGGKAARRKQRPSSHIVSPVMRELKPAPPPRPQMPGVRPERPPPAAMPPAGKDAKAKSGQNQKEELINIDRLKSFSQEHCAAKRLLTELYGPINGHDLLSLAKVCSHYLSIYLDREASRRKVVLMKWFDENLMDIKPFLRHHIVIENEVQPLGPPAFVDQVSSSIRKTKG
jgi:hypothetical protein